MDAASQERYANDYFGWFVKYVTWKFGSMGEEYASIAFLKLLETYDPTKASDFRTYAKSCATFFFLNNQRQSENGKDYSRRGVGRRNQVSLEESSSDDSSSLAEELEDRRGRLVDLGDVLRHIDRTCVDTQARAFQVCSVLGLFDSVDTALILGRRSLRGVISQ